MKNFVIQSASKYNQRHQSKNSQYYHNPNFTQQSTIRIVQKNLICVKGLPIDFSQKENLKDNNYFGKYGQVTKLIINRKQDKKHESSLQLYITYAQQRDAALAINVPYRRIQAIDGVTINCHQLKANYGTTRYCTRFLKGLDCTNKNCFYLHEYQIDNELDGYKNGVEELQDMSIQYIDNQLQYFVNKQLQESHNHEGLPSIQNTLEYLTNEGIISAEKYQALLKKGKSKHKNPIQINPKKQHKQDYIPINTTKQQISKQHVYKQKEATANNRKMHSLETSPENIDRHIEKLIIRQIMGNRMISRSRFEFAAEKKISAEDSINRIKLHIKNHLIAQA